MNIISFEEFKKDFASEEAVAHVRKSMDAESADSTIDKLMMFEYRKHLQNTVFKIVPKDHSILRTATKRFSFEEPPIDPVLISDILKEVMIVNQGVGLSANQIGFPYSIFVMGNPKKPSEILTVFNPTIVDRFGDDVWYIEGCISFPDLFLNIKRKEYIRARYADVKGNVDTEKFDRLHSRIFQHEYDHLQGSVFTTLVSRMHLERAKKDQKIIRRRRKNG